MSCGRGCVERATQGQAGMQAEKQAGRQTTRCTQLWILGWRCVTCNRWDRGPTCRSTCTVMKLGCDFREKVCVGGLHCRLAACLEQTSSDATCGGHIKLARNYLTLLLLSRQEHGALSSLVGRLLDHLRFRPASEFAHACRAGRDCCIVASQQACDGLSKLECPWLCLGMLSAPQCS